MTENLAYGYSSESNPWGQYIQYQQGSDVFQKYLRPCALDESSLSIGRVKGKSNKPSNAYSVGYFHPKHLNPVMLVFIG